MGNFNANDTLSIRWLTRFASMTSLEFCANANVEPQVLAAHGVQSSFEGWKMAVLKVLCKIIYQINGVPLQVL